MATRLRTTAGLAESHACGGDVRANTDTNRRSQSPAKQESPLVRVGIPSAFRRREDVKLRSAQSPARSFHHLSYARGQSHHLYVYRLLAQGGKMCAYLQAPNRAVARRNGNPTCA